MPKAEADAIPQSRVPSMSSELERLLAALYERDTCEPEHRDGCERRLRRLLEDALQRISHVSRAQFMEASGERYPQFHRARRKPPPPKLRMPATYGGVLSA